MNKLKSHIVIASISIIACSININARAEVVDFERYFEEIQVNSIGLDQPFYITGVGSDYIDLFVLQKNVSNITYQFRSVDYDGNLLGESGAFYNEIITNGMRVHDKEILDRKGKNVTEKANSLRLCPNEYGNGLSSVNSLNTTVKWAETEGKFIIDGDLLFVDATGEIVYSFEGYNYMGMPIDYFTSYKFRNGILQITLRDKNMDYFFVQFDRNFVPINLGERKNWSNAKSPYEKMGFSLNGDIWPNVGAIEKSTPKIYNLNDGICKDFPDWSVVRDLMIVDMVGAGYDPQCGHILLAKGSLRDPEYLILKNKVYPYTEYGDIRFDSIRPSDKIEPSRVLDLFEDRMVVRETENAQGKVGIMDFDGNWTVAPVFDSIGQFHNGLAPARMENGNYGYIMKDGTWAIEPLYEQAADFGCGLAAVVKDGIPMYIDDSGVIQKEFAVGTELGQFSERFAWVKENGIYTLIDMEFTPQFSGNYNAATSYCNGMSRVKLNGQEQFVNLDGEVKYEVPEGAAVSDFRDEFAIQKQDGVVTKINKSGQSVDTYDQYRNVVDLGNGLMLGETKEGGVDVFDLFGYVLEQHDKTAIVETDSGTVLLIPEEGTWFTAIRKDDYFALWDQSYPASQLKGNDDVIALLPGENLLYLGGKAQQIDQDNEAITPVVRDERTMVPLRVISETLGYNVNWNDPFITVTKYINGGKKKEIRMSLESTVFTVTDEDETTRRESMDVAPYEENGRTMVPLRFVAEQLGQQVYWDESGLVLISETERNLTNTNIAQYLALWNK